MFKPTMKIRNGKIDLRLDLIPDEFYLDGIRQLRESGILKVQEIPEEVKSALELLQSNVLLSKNRSSQMKEMKELLDGIERRNNYVRFLDEQIDALFAGQKAYTLYYHEDEGWSGSNRIMNTLFRSLSDLDAGQGSEWDKTATVGFKLIEINGHPEVTRISTAREVFNSILEFDETGVCSNFEKDFLVKNGTIQR